MSTSDRRPEPQRPEPQRPEYPNPDRDYSPVMINTWNDVARAIDAMTPAQRNQPVQCILPSLDDGEVNEMLPGICIATVGRFELYKSRSTHNNKYCPEDLVILMDHNPYAPDGALAYGLSDTEDSWIGAPQYGPAGKTDPMDQMSPQAIEDHLANLAETGIDELGNRSAGELVQELAEIEDAIKTFKNFYQTIRVGTGSYSNSIISVLEKSKEKLKLALRVMELLNESRYTTSVLNGEQNREREVHGGGSGTGFVADATEDGPNRCQKRCRSGCKRNCDS